MKDSINWDTLLYGARDKRPGRSTHGFHEEDLRCYGCVYSHIAEPWPGRPGMEAPCTFCLRNPTHPKYLNDEHEWKDGSTPVAVPMDAYTTKDMRTQTGLWLDSAKNDSRKAIQSLLEARDKLKSRKKD